MTTERQQPDSPIRFGTRGSALARAQTDLAVARFLAAYPQHDVETVVVQTEGDVDRVSSLTEIGGRGVFTNAIEQKILSGEVDAAVHSAKDLPTTLHPDVPIVAFPDRDDARDVLVSRHNTTLDGLPAYPVIGTSSRRREVQIRRLRPDARIVSIRGNIDTRLRKAQGTEFDAVVLAAAGLQRMGWGARISEVFAVDRIVPSPGQGAIAIQARAGSDAARLLARIDDARVSAAVGIERAFLGAMGAGCTIPVGAIAIDTGEGYRLVAMLADEAGGRVAFADELLAAGDERRHAAEVAARLRLETAASAGARHWPGADIGRGDLAGARVVVTRPRHQAGPLLAALADRGAEALPLPAIRIEPIADTRELDAALIDASRGAFDWLVMTSANAAAVLASAMARLSIEPSRLEGLKVAAVGAATATAAREAGLRVDLVSTTATGEGLALELVALAAPGARVLYPRSAIGREALPRILLEAGMAVTVIDVYQTRPEPDIDAAILARVQRGDVDAITFSSPSSVRNLVALVNGTRPLVTRVPSICAGPVTASAAREAGFLITEVSADPGAAAMADAVATAWRRANDGRGQRRAPQDETVEPQGRGAPSHA